jgi:uncharacterized integral membrane protein
MSGKITISLVVAFLLALFSIFNTELMDLNLFGVKVVSIPKSLLVFFVFLIGAVYAGFLAFFEQLHSALTIKRLRKNVMNLKKIIEEQEDVLETVGKPEKEREPELSRSNHTELKAGNDQTKVELTGSFKKEDKGKSFPGKDGEYALSPEQREIALMRIQND